ncbi:G patch domain-containing protein 11 isoform X1 [Scleropages formosus]|uniref:G patch domain-containing protein 11 n=2 Tax=Scleropages formosus TaxID=113540 RepID=A0A8C9RIH5_SCLFO|nr:G patch domain-containing protein 11 isoform X1 [Scleropages formosus]
MSDDEEDYMSDTFLNKMPDVRPGVPMLKRVKEALRKEEIHKEKNLQNRQKTYKEQEQESRETKLQSSISNENKGFALLAKMGYKAGQGLGKDGAGRVEPIPLNIKSDRGGIGMEEVKKRKAEEKLECYRQKVRVQQQAEKQSLEDYRVRMRTEREERQTEGDLRRSQRVCEQLDSKKGITVPREDWYWPDLKTESNDDDDDDDDSAEEEDDEQLQLSSLEKLHILTSYLRGEHLYCIWCGTTYNNEEDLHSNCPGDTAADHD